MVKQRSADQMKLEARRETSGYQASLARTGKVMARGRAGWWLAALMLALLAFQDLSSIQCQEIVVVVEQEAGE